MIEQKQPWFDMVPWFVIGCLLLLVSIFWSEEAQSDVLPPGVQKLQLQLLWTLDPFLRPFLPSLIFSFKKTTHTIIYQSKMLKKYDLCCDYSYLLCEVIQ